MEAVRLLHHVVDGPAVLGRTGVVGVVAGLRGRLRLLLTALELVSKDSGLEIGERPRFERVGFCVMRL